MRGKTGLQLGWSIKQSFPIVLYSNQNNLAVSPKRNRNESQGTSTFAERSADQFLQGEVVERNEQQMSSKWAA